MMILYNKVAYKSWDLLYLHIKYLGILTLLYLRDQLVYSSRADVCNGCLELHFKSQAKVNFCFLIV